MLYWLGYDEVGQANLHLTVLGGILVLGHDVFACTTVFTVVDVTIWWL